MSLDLNTYRAITKTIPQSGLPLMGVAGEIAKETQENVTAFLPSTASQVLRQLEDGIHAAERDFDDVLRSAKREIETSLGKKDYTAALSHAQRIRRIYIDDLMISLGGYVNLVGIDIAKLFERIGDSAAANDPTDVVVSEAYTGALMTLEPKGMGMTPGRDIDKGVLDKWGDRMISINEKFGNHTKGDAAAYHWSEAADILGAKSQDMERRRGLYLRAAAVAETPWVRAQHLEKLIRAYTNDATLSDRPGVVIRTLEGYVRELVVNAEVGENGEFLQNFYLKIVDGRLEKPVAARLLLAAVSEDDSPHRRGMLFDLCARLGEKSAVPFFLEAALEHDAAGDWKAALNSALEAAGSSVIGMAMSGDETGPQKIREQTEQHEKVWNTVRTMATKAMWRLGSPAKIDEIYRKLEGLAGSGQSFGRTVMQDIYFIAEQRKGILYLRTKKYEEVVKSFLRLGEFLKISGIRRAIYIGAAQQVLYLMADLAIQQKDPAKRGEQFETIARLCGDFLRNPSADEEESEVLRLKVYATEVAALIKGGVQSLAQGYLPAIDAALKGDEKFNGLSDVERSELARRVASSFLRAKAVKGHLTPVDATFVSMAMDILDENRFIESGVVMSLTWLENRSCQEELKKPLFEAK